MAQQRRIHLQFRRPRFDSQVGKICWSPQPAPSRARTLEAGERLPLPRCPSVAWLRRTWPSCMCVPLPPAPCPARGPPPRSQAWFSLLSLPGPRPPPPGPFSPSLSRFRKEASSAAPPGTPPPAQIPSAEKKPDPPVRPAWPPGLFVTQEPHLGRNGLGALRPPTPTSARPCRPTSLWPDRTGALLAPTPLTWTGAPPCIGPEAATPRELK